MRRLGFTMAVAIGVAAIGITAGADAPAFVYTSIDVPVPGAVATGVFGINAGGEVVGFYRDAANRQPDTRTCVASREPVRSAIEQAGPDHRPGSWGATRKGRETIRSTA